jgi:hypothetical protein
MITLFYVVFSGVVSQGFDLLPVLFYFANRRLLYVSLMCVVLAPLVGCRESETNGDVMAVPVVHHRLSFIENSTTTIEKLKREVYLTEGRGESIRLQELPFFGMKETEAVVGVEIRNNGDTTTEIIGYSTGCGCSKVELESKIIPPGQSVQLRMSVRINPTNSMSERVIAVGLSFAGNCSAQLQLPIVAIPAIRVLGFPGNQRTALDAGTIDVQQRADGSGEFAVVEFDVSLDFLSIDHTVQAEDEMQLRAVTPDDLSYHFTPTGHIYTEQLGNRETNWVRYRVELEVPSNAVLPQPVQIELLDQSGLNVFLGLSLDRKTAFEITPATFVFKRDQTQADVTIRRSDGAELGVVETKFNERLLGAIVNPLDKHSASIRLSVKHWPDVRLAREELTLTTNDGLTSVVRIIMISPQISKGIKR